MGSILKIKGCIRNLEFRGQACELPCYDFDSFDINRAKPAGLICFGSEGCVAYSKWTGPKRTRTYPFAHIYDTYGFAGKIVTIIPVLKDEGRGERKNDTNLDRINYITYSWMNLSNVYIILAWYEHAQKQSDVRITNQRFNSQYIREQVQRIKYYRLDAHHWNRQHFRDDFVDIYMRALKAYERISRELGVILHQFRPQEEFLQAVVDDGEPVKLDIDKFRMLSLLRSERSAQHETVTHHQLERVSGTNTKALFHLRNNLGGEYYLTADEVVVEDMENIVIRECKNTSKGFLPARSDIKDGLFKLLLFSRLEGAMIDDRMVHSRVELRLTGGKLTGEVQLPVDDVAKLERFAQVSGMSRQSRSQLLWLNEEARLVGIPIVIEGVVGS